jgi:hypothetical protein
VSYHTDCFIIVNGPEDGTEFPVARTPLYIGRDPGSAVNVRLDSDVDPQHALATAVSGGYRIRATGPKPVVVNGKRIGRLRSAVARSGSTIQVGNTLLCVECSQQGLANRSQGIVTESDFVWAAQKAVKSLVGILHQVINIALIILARVLRSKLAILAILVLLFIFFPPFHNWVLYLLGMARYKLFVMFQSFIHNLFTQG